MNNLDKKILKVIQHEFNNIVLNASTVESFITSVKTRAYHKIYVDQYISFALDIDFCRQRVGVTLFMKKYVRLDGKITDSFRENTITIIGTLFNQINSLVLSRYKLECPEIFVNHYVGTGGYEISPPHKDVTFESLVDSQLYNINRKEYGFLLERFDNYLKSVVVLTHL